MGKLLWQPSRADVQNANITKYMNYLNDSFLLSFTNYHELWQWSVDNIDTFWKSLIDYFNVGLGGSYDSVLSGNQMPDVKWFEGAQLNYAQQIFANKSDSRPAIIFNNEDNQRREISWQELESKVTAIAHWMKAHGIQSGDRVAAFLPNIPEASMYFLAAASLGAVWSSCSPDFGVDSVYDRFAQIEPKLLIAVDGYSYNGKKFDKSDVGLSLSERIESIENVVYINYISDDIPEGVVPFVETLRETDQELEFYPLEFNHPLWILFSSGTTGKPKAITHSHGGNFLEHIKYMTFHNDVHEEERFFWYTTTGWMMWNYVQAALLCGATIILYDGSPSYPDLNRLWKLTEEEAIAHFGTSAPFLVANMKKGLSPNQDFDLSALRSIGSTGSPLPPEGFDYVYKHIKKDLWLASMSGGTDVCTAFVGGVPTLPVYEGEIQARALGCSLFAYDDSTQPITDEVGEMVITKPMPSMPIYFWKDENKVRYKESYFDHFEGVWRHGDWVKITEEGTLIIYGRSDATLNRHGIRIGTAEIYRALNNIEALADSLIINLEQANGNHFMPLFVQLAEGHELDDDLINTIKSTLKETYTPRHVPDEIIQVNDIPYTISGKKMEAPIKKILMGMDADKVINLGAMRNPESINFFKQYYADNLSST